jgi:hypothetical protein
MTDPFVAYHGVTGADDQTRFGGLASAARSGSVAGVPSLAWYGTA